MNKSNKNYSIEQFRKEHASENMCLDKVFNEVYGDLKNCLKCGENITYKRILSRRCYQCPKCRHQLYPCRGTIFEKSTTPLMYWFYAMFLFVKSKNGLSAAELQRQLGVSYKTAYRMLRQIRIKLEQNSNEFNGTVELDETFVGGRNKNRHWDKKVPQSRGRSFKDKTPVFGMYERGSKRVYATVVANTKAESLIPVILDNVNTDAYLMTDEWDSYNLVEGLYKRDFVYHRKGQYAVGNCTTNRIENFWSVFKRTIKGSYVSVSRKYLQLYVNETVFRFNNKDNKEIFMTLTSYVCRL